MTYAREILDFWSQAGWFVIPLFMLSCISWVWLICLYLKLNQSEFRTSFYEAELTRRLLSGDKLTDIHQWLSQQQGIVPRIIEFVFRNEQSNQKKIQSRYVEASTSEINAIEKEFTLLGLIVKTAPLVGLLGTVGGMIETFSALSTTSGMEVVSSGISKALLTTQLGLVIAIPGVFGLVYLKRKFKRFVLELNRLQFHINALSGGHS